MIDARYFNRRVATATAVSVAIADERVVVRGGDVDRDEAFGAVLISERIGRTPRFIRFSDGAFCEVTDVAGLEAMLAAASVPASALSRWETSGRLVGVLAIVLLVAGAGAYWFGLPIAARAIADRLPVSALEGLSEQTLKVLDTRVFDPTALPIARQRALSARFDLLRWPRPAGLPMRILFRRSDDLGANALALPSGAIVVTDALVALAVSDDEIVAVLAHEAGHVQERHGLRGIIQSSVVSLFVTWMVGDVGSLVAVAPAALLEAQYSRALERDADAYAAATLQANGLSLGLLADVLERMEQAQPDSERRLVRALSYMSTHPATAERIAALRR